MSKRLKTKRNGGTASASTGKKFSIVMLVLITLAALVILGLWLNRSQPAPTLQDVRPAETNVLNAPVLPMTPKPEPGFRKLVGRWLRPDGGYVIEVKHVNESGKMDASYFNPNPIHVAKAEASHDSTVTKVFLELRDVNYPGSQYYLIYDQGTDRLTGTYFQAALKETFEVEFIRTQ